MAQREFGRLDIMICNAGFGYYGTIEDTPPDVMQRMMDVNYMGTFYGARAALPIFRRQNSGHLIFVSSIVGRRGIPLMGGYSATQGGAGRASPSRCAPSSPARRSHVSLRVSGLDARRSSRRDGARLRPPDLRPRTEAVGRRGGARRSSRCIRRPRPEVYPHALSRGLAILSLLRAALHRSVRAAGTSRQPRCRLVAIPGGSFLMGSDAGQDDERPVHRVHVDALRDVDAIR